MSLLRSLGWFGNHEPVAEATGDLPPLLRSELQMPQAVDVVSASCFGEIDLSAERPSEMQPI
jgi:hypothetical protein